MTRLPSYLIAFAGEIVVFTVRSRSLIDMFVSHSFAGASVGLAAGRVLPHASLQGRRSPVTREVAERVALVSS
jgi:hypothetical protein